MRVVKFIMLAWLAWEVPQIPEWWHDAAPLPYYCTQHPCDLWCKLFWLDDGTPALQDPSGTHVFCEDWAPAREPLRWWDEVSPNS